MADWLTFAVLYLCAGIWIFREMEREAPFRGAERWLPLINLAAWPLMVATAAIYAVLRK